MAEVKTVRIYLPHDSGEWARINEADFDPAKHVLFDERPLEAPIQDDVSRETPVTSVTDRDVSRLVTDVTPAPRKRGRPRKDA